MVLNACSTISVSGNAAIQHTSTKKLPKNFPKRYCARLMGFEKINGLTLSRKSLITGSPIITAVKIGGANKNEKALRPLAM